MNKKLQPASGPRRGSRIKKVLPMKEKVRIPVLWVSLLLFLAGFSSVRADEFVTDGFEQWTVFDSPAGNQWLDARVKGGWLGDQPPYRNPSVEFQMGPARIYCREGVPGKEVVAGKYALGVVTTNAPLNILTSCRTTRSARLTRWQVSAWMKGKGTVRFRIYAYNDEPRCIDTPFIGTFEVTPEWKQYRALYEPGKMDIKQWFVVLEVATNATVDIDEVSMGPPGGKQALMPPNMPTPVADSEKVAVAFPASGTIQVDGRLDEEAWQKAEWHAGFLRHRDQAMETPVQAQFAFLFDTNALYLGFASAEGGKDISKIKATAPGEWPPGDPIEWFLDPEATCDAYYQFAANLLGCTYEGLREDAQWNGEWKAAGNAEANRWTLEARIPFSAFGRGTPRLGEIWGMNVCRNGTYMGPWAAVGPRYHTPAGFGSLTFGAYPEWWKDGFVPWQKQRYEELAGTLARDFGADPSLAAQMQMVTEILKALDARAAKGGKEPLNREMFLELFRGAEKVRILMENVKHECRWMQIMKSNRGNQ